MFVWQKRVLQEEEKKIAKHCVQGDTLLKTAIHALSLMHG